MNLSALLFIILAYWVFVLQNKIRELEKMVQRLKDVSTNSKLEESDDKVYEFRNQLDMFLKECVPGTVYYIVNEGEYIDIEEATIETQEFTDWEDLDPEELAQWITDLESALKLELGDMID